MQGRLGIVKGAERGAEIPRLHGIDEPSPLKPVIDIPPMPADVAMLRRGQRSDFCELSRAVTQDVQIIDRMPPAERVGAGQGDVAASRTEPQPSPVGQHLRV